MKNSVVLICFLLALCVSSCTDPDDLMNPANLSGTTWKSFGETKEVYSLIKFISKSEIEGWHKAIDADEALAWTGTYSVKRDQLKFDITTVDKTAYFSEVVTMTGDSITFSNRIYVKLEDKR